MEEIKQAAIDGKSQFSLASLSSSPLSSLFSNDFHFHDSRLDNKNVKRCS